MLVSFHTICFIIAELSPSAWQREARNITYQAISAMAEARNNETDSNLLKLTSRCKAVWV